ncbi:MAG: hypothetical protein GPJ06_06660 [Microcystis aeruginosa G13-11]|jgi:hypothetical protein|nr:hypothetical protein [Microcystis aeruginosa G13-11]
MQPTEKSHPPITSEATTELYELVYYLSRRLYLLERREEKNQGEISDLWESVNVLLHRLPYLEDRNADLECQVSFFNPED